MVRAEAVIWEVALSVLGSDVFQARGLCWARPTRARKALLSPPRSLARALRQEEESLCGLSRQ